MSEEENNQEEDNLTEEDILKLAQSMKDNVSSGEEKHNVHTFLNSVVTAQDSKKISNIKEDKELNELGIPNYNVRDNLELIRISEHLVGNKFLSDYFKQELEDTLSTSLSRSGFLVRQATTTTKQVADATKRVKENKGWFKSSKETTGGDITSN